MTSWTEESRYASSSRGGRGARRKPASGSGASRRSGSIGPGSSRKRASRRSSRPPRVQPARSRHLGGSTQSNRSIPRATAAKKSGGAPDAHQVPRRASTGMWGAPPRRASLAHRRPSASPTDSPPTAIRRRACPRSPFALSRPQVRVDAALHDAEQRLVGPGVGRQAALGPGRVRVMAAATCRGRQGRIDHSSNAMAMSLPSASWISTARSASAAGWTRPGGCEGHPVVVDRAQVGQAEHLEPAGIGQDRAIPAHEPCRPPSAAMRSTGPERQVVGVGQQDLGARRAQGAVGVRPLTVAWVPTGMNWACRPLRAASGAGPAVLDRCRSRARECDGRHAREPTLMGQCAWRCRSSVARVHRRWHARLTRSIMSSTQTASRSQRGDGPARDDQTARRRTTCRRHRPSPPGAAPGAGDGAGRRAGGDCHSLRPVRRRRRLDPRRDHRRAGRRGN